MHREPEFAYQRLAGRFVVAYAPAEVLYLDIVHFPAGRNGELVAIDHHPNRQSINFGDRSRDRRRTHCLCGAEQRGNHRAEHGSAAAAEHTTSIYWKSFMAAGHGVSFRGIIFDADKTACVHFEGEHGGTLWRGKSVFSTGQFGQPRGSMSSC